MFRKSFLRIYEHEKFQGYYANLENLSILLTGDE